MLIRHKRIIKSKKLVIMFEIGMTRRGKYTLPKIPAFAVKVLQVLLKQSVKNDQKIVPER